MGITLTQTSTLSALRARSTHNYARSAGFLPVQDASLQAGATGGFPQCEWPRNNKFIVQLQPSTDALIGTGVSAAQGSQKPETPSGVMASGVPPRSRPV
jgi:hypothetical protein